MAAAAADESRNLEGGRDRGERALRGSRIAAHLPHQPCDVECLPAALDDCPSVHAVPFEV